jgi:hypothetical protein
MLRCSEALSLNEIQNPSKRTDAESIIILVALYYSVNHFFLNETKENITN